MQRLTAKIVFSLFTLRESNYYSIVRTNNPVYIAWLTYSYKCATIGHLSIHNILNEVKLLCIALYHGVEIACQLM